MKRKWGFALLLLCALLLWAVPAFAADSTAATVILYDANGNELAELDSGRTYYAPGGGTATFRDGVLQLRNYNGGAIYSHSGDLIIELVDGSTNTLQTYSGSGIHVDMGSLVIRGAGSLTVSAGGAESGNAAIWAGSNITIKGGTISAKGVANGIQAQDGSFFLEDGDVEAVGSGSNAVGVLVEKDVSIEGGRLAANGMRGGIFSNNGNISISGGNISGVASGAQGYGIWSEMGSIFVNGGNVVADGSVCAMGIGDRSSGRIYVDGYGLSEDTRVLYEVNIQNGQLGNESGKAIANFSKRNTYTAGLFPDVVAGSWYHDVVKQAWEFGLMVGKGDGFDPTGDITLAEALVLACRMHDIYHGGDGVFVQQDIWYSVYVDYAVANGIIKADDFSSYTVPATRAQMAYIFANTLPETELQALKTVNALPDVERDDPYASSIFLLYQAGVLGGKDDAGSFYPNANISRAETAAIVCRMVLPAERLR